MKNKFDNSSNPNFITEEEDSLTITNEQNNINNISIEIKNGYGACKAYGCGCNGYKPNDPKNEYCRVCGHHWERHW
jgi:hypothetical protein